MATRPIPPRPGARERLFSGRLLIALSVLAVGCGDSKDSASPTEPGRPSPRVLVGEVEGTDAEVGVVASSVRARFYFCGGPASYLTLTRWFPVDIVDTGDVTARLGGLDLDATLDGAGAKGTIREADGTSHVFAATEVAPGTVAGLYESASPCGKVGLIVSQSSASSPAAGLGACVTGDTEDQSVRQVNPILPIIRDANGAIRVVVDGTEEAAGVRAAMP